MTPPLLRVRNGAMAGVAVAALALAVGLARAIFALLAGGRVSFAGVLPDVLWYAAGFVLGGALVGLLWPPEDAPIRRTLVFILGMSVLVGVIVILESGSPTTWGRFEWLLWAGLSALFGLALSFGYGRFDG